MRHRIAGRKFSRPTEHRLAMYRNMVADLIRYGKIVTTEAKAKEVSGFAEKMISLGKEGSLASRKMALSFATDEEVVAKLFNELAPKYANRAGGYTRIVKIGTRIGDAARMVRLELVD